ncbi:hypothetical protein [Parvibaculum sp.]|uniref:hypothetical protein n=1 Tax=Parvibaculum sp. TaxID=2024848 RepID=UPI000C4B2E52|nr:hypothetical protein [Parvibaculum sp.]MAM95706.1 hypothetical protein [Parvibaculum sp.]
MTDLLHFPDDETKAFRRARAEACARAAQDARVVESCLVLLNDCIASRPGRDGKYPAPDLARWMSEAQAVLHEVKAQPAQIRMEAGVAERCLKLKGLIDEAELSRFVTVTACEPSSLDMAREVNDDLVNRARRFSRDGKGPIFLFDSTPGAFEDGVKRRFLEAGGASRLSPGQAASGARRAPGAPAANLTPGLISRDLRLPAGAPVTAGETAGAVTPPSSSVAAFAVHFCVGVGRSVGTMLRPSRMRVRSLFHGARMPRTLRKVMEKGRGLFSRARGGA